MTKRLIDIDDERLVRATEILGASTMKQAVNEALEQVILLAARREHVRRLAEMDGLDLADDGVMVDAWR